MIENLVKTRTHVDRTYLTLLLFVFVLRALCPKKEISDNCLFVVQKSVVQKQKTKGPFQCHFLILCHDGVGSGPRSTHVSPFSCFHHDPRLSRHALWLAAHFCFTFCGSGSRCSYQFDRCLRCRTVYSRFHEHHQCVVVIDCIVVHTDLLPQLVLYYHHLM